jgi:hypothetical protein
VHEWPLGAHAHEDFSEVEFFCERMAAGKSTLARDWADREKAALFVQDDLLDTLFPGEITDIQGFVTSHEVQPALPDPHFRPGLRPCCQPR